MNTHTTKPTRLLTAADCEARLLNIGKELFAFAQEFAQSLDTNPGLLDEWAALGRTRAYLQRIERLGRGQIDRRLFDRFSAGARAAGRLALSEQARLLDEGVQVLTPDGSDFRVIPLDELSTGQVSQCFHDGALRTAAEQRTWLEEHKDKPTPLAAPDVRACRGKLVINSPVTLTTAQVLDFLKQMQ